MFSRQTFTNRSIWVSLIAVLVLQVLVVNLDVLQGIFDTTAMSPAQRGLALLVGSSVLCVEEIREAIVRRRNRIALLLQRHFLCRVWARGFGCVLLW